MFKVEENQSKSARERLIRDMNEDRTIVPDLILTQENQKLVHQVTRLPKTCPVCLTRTSFNQRANDYLCHLIGAPIKSDKSAECISTEDTLSGVDRLNEKIVKEEIKPRNLIVGSLDVKALYSNINTKVAAEKVRD